MGYAAAELMPLYLRLRELGLGSAKIAVDETVAPVLSIPPWTHQEGILLGMISKRDGIGPGGGTDPPPLLYTYALPRGCASTD